MSTSESHEIRDTLAVLIEREQLPKQNIEQAMGLAPLTVSATHWRSFINTMLLWFGAISFALGIVFFVAANWQYLGRFAKFVLLELVIVASVLPYFFYPKSVRVRQASLLSGMLLVGALMAFFGQTYQTGADPWQLFFNWALVTFPWVLISRFSVMWFIWLALLNLALQQYLQIFWESRDTTTGLFLFSCGALCLWQLSMSKFTWLNKAWAIDLIGLVCGIKATWLFILHLYSDEATGVALWVTWSIVMYRYYRHVQMNVFMLALLCLSALVSANSLLIWLVDDSFEVGLFLLLTVLTICGGGASAIWLKRLIEEKAG